MRTDSRHKLLRMSDGLPYRAYYDGCYLIALYSYPDDEWCCGVFDNVEQLSEYLGMSRCRVSHSVATARMGKSKTIICRDTGKGKDEPALRRYFIHFVKIEREPLNPHRKAAPEAKAVRHDKIHTESVPRL